MLLTLLAQTAYGAAPIFSGVFIFILLIGLLLSLFWLWMLIDAILNEPTGTEKIVWVLVIFFLHFLGALLYFLLRKSGRHAKILT